MHNVVQCDATSPVITPRSVMTRDLGLLVWGCIWSGPTTDRAEIAADKIRN